MERRWRFPLASLHWRITVSYPSMTRFKGHAPYDEKAPVSLPAPPRFTTAKSRFGLLF